MEIWPRIITSNISAEETKKKIIHGYDQAIKNEFFFSESFIQEGNNQDILHIIVKGIRMVRRGGPTKYQVKIEGDEQHSKIKISSNTLIFRMCCIILCICFVYYFSQEPLIFNYLVDFLVFFLSISIIIMFNVMERKKILEAIKKTIK